MRRSALWLVVLTSLCCVPAPVLADLDAYLKKPEPAYRWEKTGQRSVPGGTVYDLQMVSQTWQGIVWQHRLSIYRPDNVANPRFCALLNTGGSGSKENDALAMAVASRAGTLFAVLNNIPNQPLYGGKTEDALVVYTWLKYLETGDESWPLHFPMAKAVLKAMDTVQAFARQNDMPAVGGFMVTGASKRGWTTWLVGASRDPRVKSIAPMVIDVLNVPAQLKHQLEAYGEPSEQVGDYTSAGLIPILQSPKGQKLLALEDPYSYRDRLTQPKLLILGTNDRYWTQDALNLYWDGLKGPKWVAYIPNSGHGLEDRTRVLATLSAFTHKSAIGERWPSMSWRYGADGSATTLRVETDIPAVSARLFRAAAATQDFRDSRWTSEPMEGAGKLFTGRLSAPDAGYAAMYGELTYELDGKTFTLTTQIRILAPRP
ncbi:MAG: hypothetical protein IT208_09540 [Chthonomonadales bacterium]|nr:hypothetical protein [Chthonomonadales bacterium]